MARQAAPLGLDDVPVAISNNNNPTLRGVDSPNGTTSNSQNRNSSAAQGSSSVRNESNSVTGAITTSQNGSILRAADVIPKPAAASMATPSNNIPKANNHSYLIAGRKKRPNRGPYDRNVNINEITTRSPENDQRRHSSRVAYPGEKYNLAQIKCPICRKNFRLHVPLKFYDGFVACSANCWKIFN